MLIALIRHGQTDWNLTERMQGRSDIPLNATGREQALVAASALANESWDVVVSSPLGRARETAEIIAGVLDVPLGATYDDLVEQNFGEAEGMFGVDLDQRWPDRDFAGKEPDAEVGPRGIHALGRIAVDHPGARVLAVAHGTLIRCTLAAITGHEEWHYPKLDNASSSFVRFTDAAWRVHTVGGADFTEVLVGIDARAEAPRPVS